MKKILKPGFEFIFSISLIVIMGLPPLVLAQTQKNVEIKIINGDTTVNGKDIKKLSAADRKEALATIGELPNTISVWSNDNKSNNRIIIKRQTNSNNGINDINIEKDLSMLNNSPADGNKTDSARKDVRIRLKRLKGADSALAFTYRFDNEMQPMEMSPFRFNSPNTRPFIMHNRNVQTFSYSNTDNDGISTNISFMVTGASKDKLKRIAGVDKADLNISDLNLSPEFSTGKTTLMFTLPAKTAADIKFIDTDGKTLWADKATVGSFSKKINLPVNGVYYLLVKQGANVALKRIVKE